MSGYQFATKNGLMGEAPFALLFAPIVAIAAAAVHSRKGYATCAILAAVVILLVGPVFPNDMAAAMGVERGYGVFMCFAGCLGMLIGAFIEKNGNQYIVMSPRRFHKTNLFGSFVTESEPDSESIAANARSGSVRRFGVIFAVFAVPAGAVLLLPIYLDSLIPKGSPEFAKPAANNPNAPDETEETGVEIPRAMFRYDEPSKEMIDLQSKTVDEVEFTYDECAKMTSEELTSNIQILSTRLEKLRGNLPPSIGGASEGGPPPETEEEEATSETEEKVTVLSLALPLEVMRQIAEQKK